MAWKKIQWSDDAAAVTVRKNSGSNIGTRPRLNFIEGSNITLAISDDAGGDEIDISISASGGGVTDHGALTGLADYDHDQYLRRNGGNTVTGNLLPDATASYRDLGSSAQKWDDVYAQDVRADRLHMGGTLDMNDYLIDDVDDIQAYDANGILFRNYLAASLLHVGYGGFAFYAHTNASMNSNKITALADPTSAQDAATKAWCDANFNNYSHPSARQCTTGNWAWASITGKPSTYSPSAHGASAHTDRTRTVFYGSHYHTSGEATNVFGVGLDASTDETVSYRIRLPSDFSSLTSVQAVWIPTLSIGLPKVWVLDVDTKFGTLTENYYAHDLSDNGNAITVDSTMVNDYNAFTIASSAFTNLTASDFLNIKLNRDANNASDTYAYDIYIAGILVTYTADM